MSSALDEGVENEMGEEEVVGVETPSRMDQVVIRDCDAVESGEESDCGKASD